MQPTICPMQKFFEFVTCKAIEALALNEVFSDFTVKLTCSFCIGRLIFQPSKHALKYAASRLCFGNVIALLIRQTGHSGRFYGLYNCINNAVRISDGDN